MTEAHLIEQCRKGDRQAQFELYERTSDRIYRLLLRMTRSADDAFDLTQDTYIQAFSKFDQFEGRCALSTWLYRIAVNQALRFRRRESMIQRKLRPVQTDQVPTCDHSTDGTKLDLEQALGVLDAVDQAILLLRYQEGLSYRAIANAMDCAEGTVGSRLNRARECLRNILQESYGFPEETVRPVHQKDGHSKRESSDPQA